jgi:hypothetical protein
MAEYTPTIAGGTGPWTLQASGTVTGGRLVESTGAGTVANGSAASVKVLGVAATDAVTGGKVQVWPLAGLTHKVTASGAIAAGDNLACGANGVVVPIAAGTFGQLVGVADRAAADTALCRFVGR